MGEEENTSGTRTKRCDPVDGRTPTEQEGGVNVSYAAGPGGGRPKFYNGHCRRPTFASSPPAHPTTTFSRIAGFLVVHNNSNIKILGHKAKKQK
ncbi:hypothetical protein OUZ56_022591 [Daphnia magna]|uniref:Uncharacterized protein n=1 Tax=Daphnia magna TaxID=35525 RepID=A0ABR0AWV8_9CRUS|nr:hypothetical protein OUZ56_022591 [Daphnia magna]